jgi:V8-like Glu-specific endopeptidase
MYIGDKEISSKGCPYSELQKQIVFEFQKNGTLKYWFKKDYLKSPIDTTITQSGQKIYSHTLKHSSELLLRHIYTNGQWKANFKEQFASNRFW